MTDSPMFSVLIPSFNRPKYLKKCIESVICNTCSDYEIIISDDYSPQRDSIRSMLTEYSKNINIKYLQQNTNIGMSNNWNYLVSEAKGEYVIIIGDDDKIFPHTLSRLEKYIKANPKYDLYSFGYNVIDEDDRYCYSRYSHKSIEISINTPNILDSTLESGIIPFWIFHPFTICYRKTLHNQIRYDSKALIGSDLLFIIDSLNRGKRIYVIPEILFYWRKQQSRKAAEYQNLSNMAKNNIHARSKILKILLQDRKLQNTISNIINSYNFRKHFLYDSIVSDSSITKADITFLGLDSAHLNELKKCIKASPPIISKLRIKIFQLCKYYKLYRIRGIYHLMQYGSGDPRVKEETRRKIIDVE